MIDASLGSVHDSATEPVPPVADSPEGFNGTAIGVTVASAEGVLPPAAFTARIRNAYAVSFVRLSTAWLVVVGPLPDISVQVVTVLQLPDVFCWYWYLLTYDGVAGLLHASTERVSPTAADNPVGCAGSGIGVARMPATFRL